MSVYFTMTDKDNKPMTAAPASYGGLHHCGCWGFLKRMTRELRGHFDLISNSSSIGTLGFYGVPNGDKDRVKFLRVYMPWVRNADGDFSVYKYQTMADLYNEVLAHVPVWFKDFSLEVDDVDRSYLLLDLSESCTRNYNALRMIRNLGIQQFKYELPQHPMDILMQTEFACSNQGRREYSSDSQCIPMDFFDSYEEIFTAIEAGPILEHGDTPLRDMDGQALSNVFGTFYMARAFLQSKDLEALEGIHESRYIHVEGKTIKPYNELVQQLNDRRAA